MLNESSDVRSYIGVALPLKRFFRTFGADSEPLRSANPLSIRE